MRARRWMGPAVAVVLGATGCTILLGENKDFHEIGGAGGGAGSAGSTGASIGGTTGSSQPMACMPGETKVCTGTLVPGGKAWGGPGDDAGLAIAYDAMGDVVVAGYFHATVDFGGKMLTTPDASSDGFVAKYDPTGALLWVWQLGGVGDDRATAVVIDAQGDVLVTGNYATQVTLGTLAATPSGPGIFVAELDGAGNPKWLQGFGESAGSSSTSSGIALGTGGRVAIAGYLAGSLDLGSKMLTTPSNTDYDGIVVALDSSSGAFLWSRQVNDTTGNNQGFIAIATTSPGGFVVVGSGAGDVDFGDGEPVEAPTTTQPNVLAVAYSADGTGITWKQIYGGSTASPGQIANAVAVGSGGNIFITGTFAGQSTFGDAPLQAAGTQDLFVVDLNGGDGTTTWAESFGSSGNNDQGLGIAADPCSIVVSGRFQGTLSIGSFTLTGQAPTNGLVMKLGAASGDVLWAEQVGSGTASSEVEGAAFDPRTSDPRGSSAVTGAFNAQIDVDSEAPDSGVDSGTSTSQGGADAFFVHLSP
jgi:hypothetical protein